MKYCIFVWGQFSTINPSAYMVALRGTPVLDVWLIKKFTTDLTH